MAEALAAAADSPRWRRGPIIQPALRIIAEAGWITVVYAAASVIVSHHQPVLGPLEFAGFVLFGAIVARIGRPREEIGPLLLIAAVVVGGAVGWLASPDVRGFLPDLPRAFNDHLAGWIAGVAVIRGALIDTGERAADEVERLIRTVPAGLAVIWAYMVIAALPKLWLSFAVSALWGTVAFLSAAVVSIGLARLEFLHRGTVDRQQRRAWRWLVAAIGFGIVPVAVPIGVLSGIPLAAMLNPVVGPLQWVIGLLAIPLSWIVWFLTEIFRPIAGPLGKFLDEWQKKLNERKPILFEQGDNLGTIVGLALWVFTIFIVLLAIFVIARWLLQRKHRFAEELDEAGSDTSRAIVIPPVAPKSAGARNRALRRRRAPRDAVAAYLSSLGELEGHVDLARQPNETPAEHSARLRTAAVDPRLTADLARLAADYQLARYGERRITTPENERSVFRWQRLRRLLRASSA